MEVHLGHMLDIELLFGYIEPFLCQKKEKTSYAPRSCPTIVREVLQGDS